LPLLLTSPRRPRSPRILVVRDREARRGAESGERLDEIVIRAQFQSPDALIDAIAGGLELARNRAIARSAEDVRVPSDLGEAERVRRGAGNYAAMCAECHLRPGLRDSEIRKGLYPAPLDLANDGEAEKRDGATSKARYWVIKHGIKGTGMAAWGRAGLTDDDIWNLVAFLQVLPSMAPGEYAEWVDASPGHSHGGRQVQAGHAHDSKAHLPPHSHPPGEADAPH
jgi:mono/diheme cytochrome c family protein